MGLDFRQIHKTPILGFFCWVIITNPFVEATNSVWRYLGIWMVGFTRKQALNAASQTRFGPSYMGWCRPVILISRKLDVIDERVLGDSASLPLYDKPFTGNWKTILTVSRLVKNLFNKSVGENL